MSFVLRQISGRQLFWLTFFSSVLAAWGLLFGMQIQAIYPLQEPTYDLRYLWEICTVAASDAGFPAIVLMWCLMSLAMMAPTAFPAFRTYADLTYTEAANSLYLALLIFGYLLIWVGFSIFAAYAQFELTKLGALNDAGQSKSLIASGVMLIIAALYQFSSFKNACLNACQNPMTFFLEHWQAGPDGALKLGLRLGTTCLGCCWALMLLAFVAGTMNLIFMGLAMVIMTLEKLPQIGAHVSKPLGVFLFLAGATVIVLHLFASPI